MQDMLVPIFGENGAIIIQYVVTLAVILGLIVLVVWAIRRYGGGAVAAGRPRHACPASRSSTHSPSTTSAGWCWCGATMSSIWC